MAVVVFYEKPGCSGNARQKAWLEASGHTVVARNILQTNFSRMEMRSFLKNLPITEWFNANAPLVKSGGIVPGDFSHADEPVVLALLQANPLLIRHPFLEVDGVRRAGFDIREIHAWIGLSAALDDAGQPVENPSCRPGVDSAHRCSYTS